MMMESYCASVSTSREATMKRKYSWGATVYVFNELKAINRPTLLPLEFKAFFKGDVFYFQIRKVRRRWSTFLYRVYQVLSY